MIESNPPEPPETDVIKRAFEVAPECESMSDLKRRLIREGYMQVNAHLSGWQIKRELQTKLNRGIKQEDTKRFS